MALDKRAWRCQKGHGAEEKGHGVAPCYFALDLTLVVNMVYMQQFHLQQVSRRDIKRIGMQNFTPVFFYMNSICITQ